MVWKLACFDQCLEADDKLTAERGHYELAAGAMTLILYLRANDYKAEIQARGDTRARKAAHGEEAIHAA